jgi:hypothetical protein
MMSIMESPAGLIAVASLLFVCAALPARGQQCPKEVKDGPSEPSEARTLEGQIIYHDGIRKWFELKLDRPECGQPSIELVQLDDALATSSEPSLETLRGCRVRTKGVLDVPSTGYYSLDLYQAVDQIEPLDECTKKLPFPDYSKVKPNKSVRRYRVEMMVDYEPGDHPIQFRVTSGGKELHPWQAYASYLLTGGFVLWGDCADGFAVDKAFGTHEATPQVIGNAAFDPESAAAAGKKILHLGYTCVRDR